MNSSLTYRLPAAPPLRAVTPPVHSKVLFPGIPHIPPRVCGCGEGLPPTSATSHNQTPPSSSQNHKTKCSRHVEEKTPESHKQVLQGGRDKAVCEVSVGAREKTIYG